MPLPHDDASLYRALLARDPAYEGFWYVGVRTTGIYCRLTCPARKPRRDNVEFFRDAAAARAAGFRACLRCRPDQAGPATGARLERLRARVAADPDRRWTSAELRRHGFDPSAVRRGFRRAYGLTFAQYARAQRLGRGMHRLRAGESVLDAQLVAGYGSGSGFRAAVAAHLGRAPAAVRTGARAADAAPTLTARWLETPIGPLLAVAEDAGLHLLEFADRRALPTELATLQRRRGPAYFGEHAVLDMLAAQLAAYFAGTATAFTIPLAPAGSAFQRAVWSALRAIPVGATRTYGGLARALGRPTAARAVARANASNTVAIVVPCHRVIGADGAPVGYGGKVWRKRWLLEHERRLAAQAAPT